MEYSGVIVSALLFGSLGAFALHAFLRLRRLGFRGYVRPPARDWSYQFGATARSWTGGARVGRLNATFPLATLTFDERVARIKMPLRTVWIDRREVIGIRAWSGVLTPGLAFDTVEGSFDGVVFWTWNAAELRASMAELGWPDLPAVLNA